MKTALLVTAAALAACTAELVESGGFKVDEESLTRQTKAVKNRASNDLACPSDNIRVTVAQVDANFEHEPMQMAVAGCGKKATYQKADGDWVLYTKVQAIALP